jgi:hypothetical protein
MGEPGKAERRILSGRCGCGRVCYEVADAFEYAANCHCSGCRRATGSAFKPFGGIERELFAVSKGNHMLKIMGETDGHDARCAHCGSLLYSVVRDGKYVHVTFGTLTGEPSLKPTEHIYVGSKAAWFTITDDLPQHLELPREG